MRPLRAEDLRQRIIIARADEAADGKGGFTTSWLPIAAPMAEVVGLDGREAVMERVLDGISVYRIRIRWRRSLDIRASDQVAIGSTVLNVRAPAADPFGTRRELMFLADTSSVRAD